MKNTKQSAGWNAKQEAKRVAELLNDWIELPMGVYKSVHYFHCAEAAAKTEYTQLADIRLRYAQFYRKVELSHNSFIGNYIGDYLDSDTYYPEYVALITEMEAVEDRLAARFGVKFDNDNQLWVA